MADELSAFDEAADLPEEGTPEPEPATEPETQEIPGPPEPTFVDPNPPAPEPEEEAQEDPEPEVEDPEPEEEAERQIPYSRFQETVDRAKRAEDRLDELMRMHLNGQQQDEPSEQTTPDVDPDVESVVKPIIDRELAHLEPLLQRQRTENQVAEAENLMPGFKDLWPQVQEEYKSLSPEQQAQFDSVTGAVALAGMIQARTPNTTPSAKKDLTRRAHSESQPNPPRTGARKISAEDINNMTQEQFDAFVKAQTSHGEVQEGVDSLLQ